MPTTPPTLPSPSAWALTEAATTTEYAPQPMPPHFLSPTNLAQFEDVFMQLIKPKPAYKKKNPMTLMYGKIPVAHYCPNCGEENVTKHIYGYCEKCDKCSICKVTPWTSRSSRRICDNCLCVRCMEMPLIGPDKLCERCHNMKICTFCTRRAEAQTQVRTVDRKRTVACANCIRHNSKVKFRCFYCDGRGRSTAYINKTTKQGREIVEPILICNDCHSRPSCYTIECTP